MAPSRRQSMSQHNQTDEVRATGQPTADLRQQHTKAVTICPPLLAESGCTVTKFVCSPSGQPSLAPCIAALLKGTRPAEGAASAHGRHRYTQIVQQRAPKRSSPDTKQRRRHNCSHRLRVVRVVALKLLEKGHGWLRIAAALSLAAATARIHVSGIRLQSHTIGPRSCGNMVSCHAGRRWCSRAL